MGFQTPATVRPEDIDAGTLGPDVVAQRVETVNAAGQRVAVHDNMVEMFTGTDSETDPGRWQAIYTNAPGDKQSGWSMAGPTVAGVTGPAILAVVDRAPPVGGPARRLLLRFLDLVQLESGAVLAVNGTVTAADLTSDTNTFPIQSGTVLVPAAGVAGTLQTVAVVFPRPFAVTPRVVATVVTSADVVADAKVSGAGVNGFNLHFKRATAVATNVNWVATSC